MSRFREFLWSINPVRRYKLWRERGICKSDVPNKLAELYHELASDESDPCRNHRTIEAKFDDQGRMTIDRNSENVKDKSCDISITPVTNYPGYSPCDLSDLDPRLTSYL